MQTPARLVSTTLIICALCAMPALAGDKGGDRPDREEAAFISSPVTLTSAVLTAETETGGRAMSAEFEKEDGFWVYSIELITPDSKELEVLVSSDSGAVLKVEND